MKTCNVLGVNVTITSMDEFLEKVLGNLGQLKGKYCCFSNVHTTVTAHDDNQYLVVQNDAVYAVPDGQVIVVLCHWWGYKEAERITGHEFMEHIFAISEEKGYSHFFYGSTDETLNKMILHISMKYPKLNIVGKYSPPFRPLDEVENRIIIDSIKDVNPDFLWVGLGAPKQENWMYQHKDKVPSVMMGVGAAFDYFAGNIDRAPEWMQKWCLEWLYRLYQEPRRLFKRYLITNTKFIWYIMVEFIRRIGK